MSELGIFIDESGIFETNHSQKNNLKDLYIVSFLFHNKSMPIDEDIKNFEKFLVENGFDTMPLIRQQKPYSDLEVIREENYLNTYFNLCENSS